MASKQSKHQATTGSQSKDGIGKPVRLTILAIIYTLFLAAAIAFHAQEGVQRLMEDPARICIWSLCFLLCLVYHKKRSSYRVAAEHTVLHVDHHRTQSENRHSSRRNNTCANSINQNTICEYFSRTVDYYQPAFCQCCI